MAVSSLSPEPAHSPRPVPVAEGWYAVVPAAALPPGGIHSFTLGGRALVAWRTEQGVLRVSAGHCAHLGGDLSQSGAVVGEQLQCTLHGYRFGIDGRPAGRRLGACALHQGLQDHPCVERDGMVFVGHHPRGGSPGFSLPAQDSRGWTRWTFRHLDVPTRPTTVMQDLADLTHFESVHGYADIRTAALPTFEGPVMRVAASFDWDTGLPGRAGRLAAAFESTCHGLGYQYTETHSVAGSFHTRHLVLPRPVDHRTTRVFLGSSARMTGLLAAGGALSLGRRLAHAFVSRAFTRDVGRDARLWAALPDPLSRPDAPDPRLRAYRDWAATFPTH